MSGDLMTGVQRPPRDKGSPLPASQSDNWYEHRGVRFWIAWTALGLVYVVVTGVPSLSATEVVATAGGYCVLSAAVIAAYWRFVIRGSVDAQRRCQTFVVSAAMAFVAACLGAALGTAYHPTPWEELIFAAGGAWAGFGATFVYVSGRRRRLED